MREANDSSRFGKLAENRVADLLRRHGLPNVFQQYANTYWDIEVDGRLIEVKAARFLKGTWQFNLHRHGSLNPHPLSAYVFCLADVPYMKRAWIYLVIPYTNLAGHLTVGMSIRSLICKYGRYADQWNSILLLPRIKNPGSR